MISTERERGTDRLRVEFVRRKIDGQRDRGKQVNRNREKVSEKNIGWMETRKKIYVDPRESEKDIQNYLQIIITSFDPSSVFGLGREYNFQCVLYELHICR